MSRIYLDNCVTTKPAQEVIEAMLPYMKENFYFPASFVEEGVAIDKDLIKFKEIAADSVNADADEIHFTSGGTLANNIAIKGYISANADKGNHIICSVVDYPDILTNAAFFEQSGFEVTYLSADWDGFIDLEELKQEIRPETIMFMTTLVNHTSGTIQPLKEIKEILDSADHHIALHVDAGQAYGKIPIDVKKDGIDLMSVSAHKIHGPQGCGFLYQRKGIQLGQVIHGITRINRHQTGGLNIALIAGFCKAIELTFTDFEKNVTYLRELSDYLLEKIENSIDHTLLNGPRGERRAPHNVNISIDYIEGEAVMMMLNLNNILVATGSACASPGLKANYILMAMGRNHVQSHGSIKFTLGRFNTKQEIDETVDKLTGIVKTLRERSTLYNRI
ncbi:MAG: cysteine desulfurase family protein [Candidatus Cloacimonetes bacterium]|nr:cysteine desulfurase family protein [Candidatus Cloacimonadota bacterium]